MTEAVDYLLRGFHAICCVGNFVYSGIETLLELNYLVVSSVLGAVAYVIGVVKAMTLSIVLAVSDTLHMSMEIWKELVNLIGLIFNAGAEFGRYLFLGVCASFKWIMNTLCPWLWNGVIKLSLTVWKGMHFCWNTITSTCYSAAVSVGDSVQVGSKLGGDAVVNLAEGIVQNLRNVINAFSAFCTTAMTYFLQVWFAVAIIFSQIYESLLKQAVSLKDFLAACCQDVWLGLGTVSSSTYLTICSAIMIYFVFMFVAKHLESRGFTFPSLRQQPRNLTNILDESDIENFGEDDDDVRLSDTDGQESDNDNVSIAGSVASNHSHQSNISNGRYNLRERSPPVTNDALSRALEQERDRRRCVVCQDQAKNILILPCRHMCMCSPCAQTITRSAIVYRRICPLCRTPIEAIMSVFV